MKHKYVVLRATTSATSDVFGPRSSPFEADRSGSAVAKVTVEVDQLNRSGVERAARAKDVQAIAPVMPMKLIAPVARKKAAKGGGGVAWGVSAVGADKSEFDGTGITVAVLDTGIDATHPAFAGVAIEQRDFTGEGDGDAHGHGTHCAGTIFGRAVDGLRIGVAPGVSRALIGKVLGEQGGGSDTIADAIQWSVNSGADVISMSLGIDFPGFVAWLIGQGYPAPLATSIGLEGYRANVNLFESLARLVRSQGMFGRGSLLVAAAGNESTRDVNPDFEIGVSPPAVSDGFVSVAALGQAVKGLDVAVFSNTGANIAGPGVDIVSAAAGGGLALMSGTSMATPHVAGVAALWAQQIVKQTGMLSGATLSARVLGSGTMKGLKKGVDPSDVGVGLVKAPK